MMEKICQNCQKCMGVQRPICIEHIKAVNAEDFACAYFILKRKPHTDTGFRRRETDLKVA